MKLLRGYRHEAEDSALFISALACKGNLCIPLPMATQPGREDGSAGRAVAGVNHQFSVRLHFLQGLLLREMPGKMWPA